MHSAIWSLRACAKPVVDRGHRDQESLTHAYQLRFRSGLVFIHQQIEGPDDEFVDRRADEQAFLKKHIENVILDPGRAGVDRTIRVTGGRDRYLSQHPLLELRPRFMWPIAGFDQRFGAAPMTAFGTKHPEIPCHDGPLQGRLITISKACK
ncbi:hypothetical protein GTW25_05795 [Aliihoeflea aestuarii]|uniref:hypothetical protein n=1 Tax=Aliihoeflea aestuarii TaxID=453840 RepID=UPI00209217A3|nr:hypothetical protein [Aliihoeflea aestuarii]MCO6390539.1 hypothetical protein [Aliihoeflea aestuarii]